MLFAGFNVAEGEYSLFAVDRRGLRREPRRLVDRLRGRLRRAASTCSRSTAGSSTSSGSTSSGRTAGSSATATRRCSSPACCRSSAPSSRCPPGSHGCPSGASACSRSPGCVPWVLMLAFIGQQAGSRWESWKDSLHYVDYAVAAGIVAGVVYLLIRRRRKGRRPDRPARPPTATRRRHRDGLACSSAPSAPSPPPFQPAEHPPRGGAGARPGPGGAPAGLELRPRDPAARAARLAVRASSTRSYRKAFEVALHAGTAAGLTDRLCAARWPRSPRSLDAGRVLRLSLARPRRSAPAVPARADRSSG